MITSGSIDAPRHGRHSLRDITLADDERSHAPSSLDGELSRNLNCDRRLLRP